MIYSKIVECINRRLRKYTASNRLITEDCIRYDIYSVLSETNNTEEFVLEHPHDFYKGKELDLVIKNDEYSPVFELKYYRQIPSKKEDRTNRMAKIAVDLLKLQKCRISEYKYFVLVSDQVMLNYIKNNGYSYLLKEGEKNFKLTSTHQTGKHFSGCLKKELKMTDDDIRKLNIDIKLVYKSDLEENHEILVYKVGCFA